MVESKGTKTPLLTYGSWLDITQLSLNQLDENEVFFVYPDFIDSKKPSVKKFRKMYTARYNVPPSVFAYSGYEMMFYFGQMLHRNGKNFNASLAKTPLQPGLFFQGISYRNTLLPEQYTNDNQYVPILKMDDLQLYVVNPPLR